MAVSTVKSASSTTSIRPSCQLMKRDRGRSTISATNDAKCSRKNESIRDCMPDAPSSITLSTRPEWVVA